MNPGEYVGEDGRTYQWERLGEHWTIAGGLRINDWPKAKAALDALIESEQEEWVEIQPATFGQLGYRHNGERLQVCGTNDDWRDVTRADLLNIFRAGLKAGQEQVQELVEAVEAFVQVSPTGLVGLTWTDRGSAANTAVELLTLAKAVKG